MEEIIKILKENGVDVWVQGTCNQGQGIFGIIDHHGTKFVFTSTKSEYFELEER